MNPDDFEAISPDYEARILRRINESGFPKLVGLRKVEVRRDYARMELDHRPELDQADGLMHGGAIATMIDTVVVGAVLSGLENVRRMVTVDMHVQYLGAVVKESLVAEGWVRKRGRSIVFLSAEVRTAAGADVAHGELVYKVSSS